MGLDQLRKTINYTFDITYLMLSFQSYFYSTIVGTRSGHTRYHCDSLNMQPQIGDQALQSRSVRRSYRVAYLEIWSKKSSRSQQDHAVHEEIRI